MLLNALLDAYYRTPVGESAWVTPEAKQSLQDFQIVVAAVQAWASIGRIKIEEVREDVTSTLRFVNAVCIRRLR